MKDFELVEIQDLKAGDEIIIPCMSDLRRFKLVRDPKIRQNGHSYKSVKCSAKIQEIDKSYTNYAGKVIKCIYKKHIFSDSSEHNSEIFVDLNYKQILKVVK